jgi:hypothetical protein
MSILIFITGITLGVFFAEPIATIGLAVADFILSFMDSRL